MANRTIQVDYIARVEGESSLELSIRNGKVNAVRLSIFEPPRFFEALLRGRGFGECSISSLESAGSARSPTR